MAIRTDTEFEVPIRAKDEFSGPVDEMQKKAKGFSLSIGNLGAATIAMNQAVELAEKAWHLVKEPVEEAIAAFEHADKIERQLINTLAITGNLTRKGLDSWKNYAEEIQNTTTVGNDQVLGLVAQAKAMRLTDERTKEMVETAADLSAVTGQDLNSAFLALQGTTAGNIRAFAKLDPRLKDLTEEELKAGKAIDILSQRFKGFGAAAADSIEGAKAQLAHAFDDLLKEVGKAITTAFGRKDSLKALTEQVKEFTKFFHDEVTPVVIAFGKALRDAFGAVDWAALGEQLKIVGIALTALFGPQIIAALGALAGGFIAMAAPIALAAAQIGLIVIGVDLLVRNFTKLDKLGTVIGDTIVAAFMGVRKALLAMIDFILEKIGSLAKLIGEKFSMIPGVTDLTEKISSGVDSMRSSVGESLAKANDDYDTAVEQFNESTDQIDTGFLGEIFKQGNKFLGQFNKTFEKTLKDAKDLKDSLPENAPKLPDEELKAKKPELFSEADLLSMKTFAGQGVGDFATATSNFVGGALGFAQAASTFLDGVLKLIKLGPDLINKLASVFDAATAIGLDLANAVSHLLTSLKDFAANFLQNILKGADAILDSLLGFAEKLPEALMQTLEQVPRMLEDLIDRIPDVVQRIITSLAEHAPEIGLKIAEVLIIRAPLIAARLIWALAVKLPIAIVKGIVNGVKAAIGNIFGQKFKLPKEIMDLPKNLAKGLQASFAGSSSKLFNVTDLMENAKGITDQTQQILTDIMEATEMIGMNIWKAFLDALQRGWDFLKNLGTKIWQGFLEVVSRSWDYLKSLGTQIWQGLSAGLALAADAFRNLGKLIWDSFIAAMKAGFDIFATAGKAIWENLVGAVKDPAAFFKKLGTGIWDSFNAGLATAGGIFTGFGKAIWTSLKDGLSGIGDYIEKLLDKIRPDNLFSRMFDTKGALGNPGTVEGALGINVPFISFAAGGKVPGTPIVSGDSPINDRVLAMLSPGEEVIPRTIMQDKFLGDIIRAVVNGDINPAQLWGGTIGGAVSSVGGAISDAAGAVGGALGGAAGVIKNAVSGVSWETLTKSIKGGFDPKKASFGEIVAAVGGDIKDATAVLSSMGKTITGGSKVAFDKIAKEAGDAWEQAKHVAHDVLKYIDPRELWKLVKEKTFEMPMAMFEHNKFHEGGYVPAFAGGGEVPAMLEGNEFVVNKRSTARFRPQLEAMNAGRNPSGNVIIEKIEINAKTNLDAASIRTEVWPEIERQLKRKSQDGGYVISRTGLRE